MVNGPVHLAGGGGGGGSGGADGAGGVRVGSFDDAAHGGWLVHRVQGGVVDHFAEAGLLLDFQLEADPTACLVGFDGGFAP